MRHAPSAVHPTIQATMTQTAAVREMGRLVAPPGPF